MWSQQVSLVLSCLFLALPFKLYTKPWQSLCELVPQLSSQTLITRLLLADVCCTLFHCEMARWLPLVTLSRPLACCSIVGALLTSCPLEFPLLQILRSKFTLFFYLTCSQLFLFNSAFIKHNRVYISQKKWIYVFINHNQTLFQIVSSQLWRGVSCVTETLQLHLSFFSHIESTWSCKHGMFIVAHSRVALILYSPDYMAHNGNMTSSPVTRVICFSVLHPCPPTVRHSRLNIAHHLWCEGSGPLDHTPPPCFFFNNPIIVAAFNLQLMMHALWC